MNEYCFLRKCATEINKQLSFMVYLGKPLDQTYCFIDFLFLVMHDIGPSLPLLGGKKS